MLEICRSNLVPAEMEDEMREIFRISNLHVLWLLQSHVEHHQRVLVGLIDHLSSLAPRFRSVVARQFVFLPRIVRGPGQDVDQTKVKQCLEENIVIEVVQIRPLTLTRSVSHSFL